MESPQEAYESLQGKTAASVILKLFISGNEKFHTTAKVVTLQGIPFFENSTLLDQTFAFCVYPEDDTCICLVWYQYKLSSAKNNRRSFFSSTYLFMILVIINIKNRFNCIYTQ